MGAGVFLELGSKAVSIPYVEVEAGYAEYLERLEAQGWRCTPVNSFVSVCQHRGAPIVVVDDQRIKDMLCEPCIHDEDEEEDWYEWGEQ